MSATDHSESAARQPTRLTAERGGVVLFVLGVVVALLPFAVELPGVSLVFLQVGVTFLLWGLLVLGLNLQYGFTGLVNFGHVAFFAVGGYAAAMVTAEDPFRGIGLGFPWPVGVVAAVVAAALLGALVGATALRLRDDFLAIVTLAVAEIVHDLLGQFEHVTGADIGLGGVPRPIFDLAAGGDSALLATVLVLAGVLLGAYAFLRRLTDAPYGRVLRAIRADDRVTEALGKPVFGYKLQSFVVGAALAGLAGGLFAFFNGAVAPGFFVLNVTVLVWVGMLVGGPGSHRGVLAGLAIILGLRLLTRFAIDVVPVTQDQFASVRLVLVGLVLVLVIRYRPAGIWGDPDELGVEA